MNRASLGMIALVFAALCASCVTVVAARPSASQVASLKLSQPNADIRNLEPGRQLFMARCTMCHAAPEPMSQTPTTWPHQVARMSGRAGISPQQTEQITLYLQALSQPEPTPRTP